MCTYMVHSEHSWQTMCTYMEHACKNIWHFSRFIRSHSFIIWSWGMRFIYSAIGCSRQISQISGISFPVSHWSRGRKKSAEASHKLTKTPLLLNLQAVLRKYQASSEELARFLSEELRMFMNCWKICNRSSGTLNSCWKVIELKGWEENIELWHMVKGQNGCSKQWEKDSKSTSKEAVLLVWSYWECSAGLLEEEGSILLMWEWQPYPNGMCKCTTCVSTSGGGSITCKFQA